MWKESVSAKRFTRDANYKTISESLLMEMGLSVSFNGECVHTASISPSLILEYALGMLYVKGYIFCYSDVKRLELEGTTVFVEAQNSKPNDQRPLDSIHVDGAQILNFMSEFQENALLVRDTGISESAALCSASEILAFVDDMSAVPCFYKLIGYCIKKSIGFKQNWLIVSGKVTLDLVTSAYYCGLGQIVSRGGATAQAYHFAKDNDIALVVFTRGKEFTRLI